MAGVWAAEFAMAYPPAVRPDGPVAESGQVSRIRADFAAQQANPSAVSPFLATGTAPDSLRIPERNVFP